MSSVAMQAHVAPVQSLEEVQAVMAALLTNNKLQRATHNIMAYRIYLPGRVTHLQVRYFAQLAIRTFIRVISCCFAPSMLGDSRVSYLSAAPLQHMQWLQDYDDDGETAAGSRLLKLLTTVGAENVLVVVSRWFGGVLLGPSRFTHINNAARAVLDQYGYIKKVDGKGAGRAKRGL